MTEYSIGELADRSGVTHRTIRYYVEMGLLPPPESAGRGATYTDEHLHRLQLIKRLQSARLSLDEIREELARMRPETEGALLASGPAPPRESAAEYLAGLRQPAPPSMAAIAREPYARLADELPAFAPEPPIERGESYAAEPWTRIPLAPDVELHVRRRGNRTDSRIARLIKEARHIFSKEEPQ